MQQDGQARPMSRAEKDAYRGVTVDESGAEAQDDDGMGRTYANRSSVRYVRIGHAPQGSFLHSLLWAMAAAAVIAFFIFVALPVIVMVLIAVLIIGTIVRLIGRERILSWIMRKLYGR